MFLLVSRRSVSDALNDFADFRRCIAASSSRESQCFSNAALTSGQMESAAEEFGQAQVTILSQSEELKNIA